MKACQGEPGVDGCRGGFVRDDAEPGGGERVEDVDRLESDKGFASC